MKNHQKPEPRLVSPGYTLEVNSIFETIQGEGPHAGRPAVFVRMAGCNLQCPLCDTEYTKREEMNIGQIMAEVSKYSARLVVITGGEPLRQNLMELIIALKSQRRPVQIETNGMLDPQFDVGFLRKYVDIVVSPKTASINPNIASAAAAFKYVIRYGRVHDDGLPVDALDHPLRKGSVLARPPEGFTGTVYVQPADEYDGHNNSLNMAAAVASVMKDPNRRRLCLQLHKYADLP